MPGQCFRRANQHSITKAQTNLTTIATTFSKWAYIGTVWRVTVQWNDEMTETEDHLFAVSDARYNYPKHQMLLKCCRKVVPGLGEVLNPLLGEPGVPSAKWLRQAIFDTRPVEPYKVEIRRCYYKVPREATA